MSVLAIVAVATGLLILVFGAELLVRSASRLALTLGISPLVIGLTVVAFGTSAPEMAVGAASVLVGRTGMAVGNVIGSNVFNTLVILGVAAVVAPLAVHQKLVRREVPLMIAVTTAVAVLSLNGVLGRVEGALLLGGLVAYTVWAVFEERRERPEVAEEYAAGIDGRRGKPGVQVGLLVAGLAALVAGSQMLVAGAAMIAADLGVSELTIGLTVVAAGTSLPEAATSVVATIRGHRDIAVGNVVGSNLFNLLGVLGLSAVLAPGGLPIAASLISFDLPVLLGASVFCLAIFFTGASIRRWEGGLLLVIYAAYLMYVLLAAGTSPAAGPFRLWMFAGMSAVGLLLMVTTVRDVLLSRRGA